MSCLLTKIDRLSVLLKILHVLSTVSSSITLILKHICVPMQSIRKQFINNAKLKQINLTLKKKKRTSIGLYANLCARNTGWIQKMYPAELNHKGMHKMSTWACYWVQVLSVHCTTGQWIREMRCWGKKETLIVETADWEDGRLAPQNNHLVRA